MARRDVAAVRRFYPQGNDSTKRFPTIASAVEALLAKSCLVDGEAIVRDENGLADFDLIMATTCLRCCCSLIRNCVSATRCSRLIRDGPGAQHQ